MKAVQIIKPNQLEVIDVEKPVIDSKNNVLVKMTAAMNLPGITIPSMRLYAINSTMWTMSPVWSMRRPAMTTGRKNA